MPWRFFQGCGQLETSTLSSPDSQRCAIHIAIHNSVAYGVLPMTCSAGNPRLVAHSPGSRHRESADRRRVHRRGKPSRLSLALTQNIPLLPDGQFQTLTLLRQVFTHQLYFFLYLGKLDGRLRPDDPGWDVPWIGMDCSKLA